MDPREQAEETLARARSRDQFVVTPDSAVSPMDAAHTIRIPQLHNSRTPQDDPETTQILQPRWPTGEDGHGSS